MKKTALLAITLFVTNALYSASWFGYDKAIKATQNNEWEKARELLKEQVIDNPNRADLLYDAGVASFKTGDMEQASAYFSRAAGNATKNGTLKEQSYFNYANSCVELQKLKEAVAGYEKALEINPDNEQTKHNLEIVKKMLEEQQQQDQDNQDNNDDNKDNQDKKDDGQKSDDKNSDDDNKDEQNKNNDDKDSDNNDDQNSDQSEDNQDDQQGDDDESGKDSEQQEEEKEEQPEQEEDDKNSGELKDSSAGDEDEKNKDGDKLDTLLETLLEQQEEKDAALNKQLVKGLVSKNLSGKKNQNCW